MTNIEKLALDICRMPHSDQVMATLIALLPMMRRERDGGEAHASSGSVTANEATGRGGVRP